MWRAFFGRSPNPKKTPFPFFTPKRHIMKHPQITLNDKEERLATFLCETADYIHSKSPDQPLITLRFAGGWVRDKLLGLESHDIDVAIDSMTGFTFAQHFNDFLHHKGIHIKHIGRIMSNPDKSKHLETATVNALDYELDFVNLRSETYNEDSRIPHNITFGTPEQDALRRDITINALFFNIHTRKLEDYTKKGLRDLVKGIIRTPIDALSTFIDDPLRVLRIIRFASRFQFQVSEDAMVAARNKQVQDALEYKISRERIGVEIDKMLLGPNPMKAILLFQQLNLGSVIFIPPDRSGKNHPIGIALASSVHWISSQNHIRFSKLLSPSDKRLLYLCALLYQYHGETYLERRREEPAVKYIIKDSLKLRNDDAESTAVIHQFMKITQEKASEDIEQKISRLELGSFIRQIAKRPVCGRWRLTFIMAMADELSQFCEMDSSLKVPIFQLTVKNQESVEKIITKYNSIYHSIAEYNLEQCHLLKPLLSGNQVCSLLNLKNSPRIGEALEMVMQWQLGHPEGTLSECEAYLKANF